MERLGERIFPNNYAKAVEFLPLDRSDKVSLSLFIQNFPDYLFIVYPAFRF